MRYTAWWRWFNRGTAPSEGGTPGTQDDLSGGYTPGIPTVPGAPTEAVLYDGPCRAVDNGPQTIRAEGGAVVGALNSDWTIYLPRNEEAELAIQAAVKAGGTTRGVGELTPERGVDRVLQAQVVEAREVGRRLLLELVQEG
jgi:hypothetical protein